MQKLHFTITINASVQKVWDTMLLDKTYRIWTSLFNPAGSYYKGEWKTDSKMLFLGPNEDGTKIGGMVSIIAEVKPLEFVSIKHIGIINDDIEDTTSDEVKKWAPAFENYSFVNNSENSTTVNVDIDINDEWKDMFTETWPKALDKLKEIAESH